MYLHITNMYTYELLHFVNDHTIDIRRKGLFHHYFVITAFAEKSDSQKTKIQWSFSLKKPLSHIADNHYKFIQHKKEKL